MKTNQNPIGICLLAAALLPAVARAQFDYAADNGALTITGYQGPGGTVSVPGVINVNGTNLPVVSIGTRAFDACTNLTSVILPDSVVSLNWGAFQYRSSLTNVTFGSGLASIGGDAFYFCTSLTGIAIPGSVTNIWPQAFYHCTNLTVVTIANGVAAVGESAFAYCSSLTNVTLPGSLTNLGTGPFAGCTSLTNITVAATNPAFCSVAGVLFDRSQTTLIQYPGGLAGSYQIPAGVTNLASSSFLGCAGLTAVSFPDGLVTIGDYAFKSCSALSSVVLPGSVTDFGNDTFESCTALTNVIIPESVTGIGDYAFSTCGKLTSVTIPDSIAAIGNYAFAYCAGLTNVTIPGNVSSLGEYAFAGCGNLEGAFFEGDYPLSLGPYIFYADDSATVYYLPGSQNWSGGSWFDHQNSLLVEWNPQAQTGDGAFGVRSDQFGFTITGATNLPVVVEASTNVSGAWSVLQSLSLTNGACFFSDPQWTNYPGRFYRLRSP
jgi:hypothetical protein